MDNEVDERGRGPKSRGILVVQGLNTVLGKDRQNVNVEDRQNVNVEDRQNA